jgi:uncharacterized protein
MTVPDIEKVKPFVFNKLTRELSSKLYYHSISHTRDDVLPNVERLAKLEGITESEDWLVLRTAALYHDIGFVEAIAGHEEISMRIATETLPQFGYTQVQINRIQQLIHATKIPQQTDGLLSMILADADLDVLGRKDFFERNMDLYRETNALGKKVTLEDWYRSQIKFMKMHTYFTDAAGCTRLPGKIHNINILIRSFFGMLEPDQETAVLSTKDGLK